MFLGILSIIFCIMFLILIPYQVSNISQKYGISPQNFPYILGCVVLVCSIILVVDSFRNKEQNRKIKIEIFSENEKPRLLKYIVTFLLLPVLMERLGFFVGIIIILLILLLISGVREKITLIITISMTVIAIYSIIKFAQINLVGGILF